MRFELRPITETDARAIARWGYEEPYSIYDGDLGNTAELLNPDHRYHAVVDGRGVLIGYFCFGPDARIPAGGKLGLYEDEDILDVGLGLKPDLTGRGLGEEFMRAGLDFAEAAYAPRAFRMTVAAFNRRAILVYERLGFETVAAFEGGGQGWRVMRRDA